MSTQPPVLSPCVGVCTMDAASGYCRGCLRTITEIVRWPEYTNAEKRAVLERVSERAASEFFR
jgi:predicted Fe-S protein YdhL (DUF1289 family)